MACSECEEHEWEEKLEMAYKNPENGKEYCVFHVPQGKKGMSLEEFNSLVFQRIEATPEGETCDLSGAIFEGDISFRQFDEKKPLPDISFGGSEFPGEVDFTGVKFSGAAFFSGAKFSGYASFYYA